MNPSFIFMIVGHCFCCFLLGPSFSFLLAVGRTWACREECSCCLWAEGWGLTASWTGWWITSWAMQLDTGMNSLDQTAINTLESCGIISSLMRTRASTSTADQKWRVSHYPTTTKVSCIIQKMYVFNFLFVHTCNYCITGLKTNIAKHFPDALSILTTVVKTIKI